MQVRYLKEFSTLPHLARCSGPGKRKVYFLYIAYTFSSDICIYIYIAMKTCDPILCPALKCGRETAYNWCLFRRLRLR